MCVCVCVCAYICIYIYTTYIYVYIYIYIYIDLSVFTTCLNMYYVCVALRVGASASSRAQLTDADEFRPVLAYADADVC